MKNFFSSAVLLVALCLNANMLAGQDAYEPNNSFATSTAINLDAKYNITVFPAGDKDYFSFSVQRPGTVVINVTGIPPALSESVEAILYYEGDLTHSLVWATSISGGLKSYELVCWPGQYYLTIQGRYSSDQSGIPFKLEVNFDDQDVFECNNTFDEATPIVYNSVIQGKINQLGTSFFSNPGDWDNFSFDINQSGTISVDLTNVPSSLVLSVGIFDHNQVKLASKSADIKGQSIHLEYPDAPAGHYLVSVQNDFINSWPMSLDFYTLTLGSGSSSTEELDAGGSAISISPNPTTGHFTVTLPEESPSSLTLYNAFGKAVERRSSPVREESFDLPDKGVYFVRTEFKSGQVAVRRVVAQ